MKRFLTSAAAIAAAAAIVALALPPRQLPLDGPPDGAVAGLIHIHTVRSDGRGSPNAIAEAAARAGLKFIVFTDHGDATRKPDPPAYRAGVLCLDGVEISTSGGHYVAIDMPASPYPLGGEPRDVVEDVRRLGGFGIVAHPDSPKAELRWRDWTVPFDAVETINPDSSWRRWASGPDWRMRLRLAAAVIGYPFRSPETMANLLEPGIALPPAAAVGQRRYVRLAGADAHAKLSLVSADPGDNRFSLPFPGYESTFRALSIRARVDRPLSGNAAGDAAVLVRAIRAGHLYTAVDGLATPPSFEFSATNNRGTVHQGDELGVGGPVTLRVRANTPAEFETQVTRNDEPFGPARHEHEFTVTAPEGPASYAVVVSTTRSGRTLPWLVSNAIAVRGAEAAPARHRPAATSNVAILSADAKGWSVEHDADSLAAFDPATAVGGVAVRLRYALGLGAREGKYVALVRRLDNDGNPAPNDRLTFSIRAEHPMRISVQLRADGDAYFDRWQRTVYVDTFDQERTVYFDDLTPVGATHTPLPPLRQIHSILWVIDATNTKLGSSGRVWVRDPRLQK